MPRKADERGFGFRSEGLLRILLAADGEQVLIALEQLGFVPTAAKERAEDSLEELVIAATRLIIPPLDLTLDLIEFSNQVVSFAANQFTTGAEGRRQLLDLLERNRRLTIRLRASKKKIPADLRDLKLPTGAI